MVIANGAFLSLALQDPTPISASIDLDKTREEINPYIYGQFIEHLGRCIYGGIWAEMLEDRKFFHPITTTYSPYVSMLDTDFPGVGASPWEITAGSVEMTKQDIFVGRHTPILADGTQISQHRLGIIEGNDYVGYIWLKALTESTIVTVTFASESVMITVEPGDYFKFPFTFKADQTSDEMTLSVTNQGGPVALGTLSLMPANNVRGMRADTLEHLKALGGTIYRWPGGNFVSGYDWRDGIGDRDRRPPRGNPAWGGVEHNDFGTDEFLDFCKEIGTDPLIAVNTGFGDAYTAAQWVDYCNGSPQTIGGSWRVQNGHTEPYGIKIWCVGNEMWGDFQLGYMKLDHYTRKHNWVAEAMLKADPSLTLVGSGDLGDPEVTGLDGKVANRSWSKGMLEQCAEHMDLISEHFYDGQLPWNNNQRFSINEAVKQMATNIRKKADGHRKMQDEMPHLNGKSIPIAMDEWNYWHRDYIYGELGCEYNLADALGIAAGLHEFFRQTDIIHIATYAQTVNVIGAIKTNRTAAEMESTGLVLQVYRQHYGSVPVEIKGNFGELDIEAALSADKKTLTIGVVNPTNKAVTLELNYPGANLDQAKSYIVTGEAETDKNAPGRARSVDIIELNGTTIPRLGCGVITIPL
jgi:alpha-N-arabinofuranosidase